MLSVMLSNLCYFPAILQIVWYCLHAKYTWDYVLLFPILDSDPSFCFISPPPPSPWNRRRVTCSRWVMWLILYELITQSTRGDFADCEGNQTCAVGQSSTFTCWFLRCKLPILHSYQHPDHTVVAANKTFCEMFACSAEWEHPVLLASKSTLRCLHPWALFIALTLHSVRGFESGCHYNAVSFSWYKTASW